MTNQDVPAENRAEWREWAVREFGDDKRSVELATDVVLKSLNVGYSPEQSVAIARTMVRNNAPKGSDAMNSNADSKPAEPHLVSDAEHLRGRVSLFRARNELVGKQYGAVWNFRVDSWDPAGKPQPAVAVEMRGLQFSGSLGNGDWVEIPGDWKAGENMRVNQLRNITMNAPVVDTIEAPGRSKGGKRLVAFILVLVLIVLLAMFLPIGGWF